MRSRSLPQQPPFHYLTLAPTTLLEVALSATEFELLDSAFSQNLVAFAKFNDFYNKICDFLKIKTQRISRK